LPYQKGGKAKKKKLITSRMNHPPLNIKAISCLGVPPMGGGLFKRRIINHVKLLCTKKQNKYINPNGK
jgi:hypothetical protein